MKKFLSFVLILLIIGAVAAAFLFANGFGFGEGFGGLGNPANSDAPDSSQEQSKTIPTTQALTESPTEAPTEDGDKQEEKLMITVEKNEYIMDGKIVSLTELEEFISENDSITYIIEDNYASVKAWDDIQKLFSDYNIPLIEQ